MTTTMHCSVCARTHPDLNCSNCANDALYSKRLEIATVMAEKERYEAQVEALLAGPKGKVERIRAESEQALLRIAETKEMTKRVETRNAEDKAKLASLREQHELRRAHLARQTEGVASLRQATSETVQAETSKQSGKLNTLSSRTQDARAFLCREAAQLYGLRPRRRASTTRAVATLAAAATTGGAGSPAEMQIGGVAIPTLAELNKTPCAQISTVLAHLSHLLVLAAHYLSLKLPHEIVLPARGGPETRSPFTIIKSPKSQRPRPLYIPMDLPVLMRENPSMFSLFLEGYAMLCHNVSFLCFTQGLDIPNVENLTNPGLAMYRILVARDSTPEHPLVFGIASHGSALNSLAKNKGQEALRRWTVTLNQILEVVRNAVQGDTVAAEWDLVDIDEKELANLKLQDAKEESKDRGWTKVRPFKPTS